MRTIVHRILSLFSQSEFHLVFSLALFVFLSWPFFTYSDKITSQGAVYYYLMGLWFFAIVVLAFIGYSVSSKDLQRPQREDDDHV